MEQPSTCSKVKRGCKRKLFAKSESDSKMPINMPVQKSSKHTTEDLIMFLLGQTPETCEYKKYKRLVQTDRSFQKQYERILALIQIRISKLHRELKEQIQKKNNDETEQKITYSELLLRHWSMYLHL
ncbi:uncharacterized protein LOC130049389 [Ostrea edulis]|uniref:uncharacterized protein LOC130049387 n=1 Tax=Ostrea edulis TaxID=37623 RepID=UPI0024AFCC3B|nr:uncharacterized protein LOC130049387 [Ostrea edulis]XP_056002819.1 uncharacterized protein LOC130049389 [Ostrea edulis]